MSHPSLSAVGSGASSTTATAVTTTSYGNIQYRRSTRTALYVSNGKNDDPNKKQQFPRRWPGIGSTFQCKVPTVEESLLLTTGNNNYESKRPVPLLMSNEYPHCTLQDMEKTTCIISDTERNGKIIWRNANSALQSFCFVDVTPRRKLHERTTVSCISLSRQMFSTHTYVLISFLLVVTHIISSMYTWYDYHESIAIVYTLLAPTYNSCCR
jgi:hypothetical protein